MWDLANGTLTNQIATEHTNLLMAMWVEESFLFTAALDGHVKVRPAHRRGLAPPPPCHCPLHHPPTFLDTFPIRSDACRASGCTTTS
jgi:hypothetical protein